MTGARAEAEDPGHLFAMRSFLDLPRGWEVDVMFRAIGELRATQLPGYQELDARLGGN